MSKKTGKGKKIAILLAAILVAALFGVYTAEMITEANARFIPGYEMIELMELAGMGSGDFSGEEYALLFRQTGLGKAAVDSVFSSAEDPASVLAAYQEKFFNPPEYTCYNIGIGTQEERFLDKKGNAVFGFEIADVRTGDIVVSKLTHSVGWRHGHAGIVIDAGKGKTFEAIYPGTLTMVQDLSKWRTFPTYIQLRHKDPEIGEAAAAIAVEDLSGVYWRHHAGILGRSDKPGSTQCSHLIWHAFGKLGYDINSSRLWPVTPKGLVNSEHLEVVQIYGVDPERIWK